MAPNERSPHLGYPRALQVIQEACMLVPVISAPHLEPQAKKNLHHLLEQLMDVCKEAVSKYESENLDLLHQLGTTAVSAEVETPHSELLRLPFEEAAS